MGFRDKAYAAAEKQFAPEKDLAEDILDDRTGAEPGVYKAEGDDYTYRILPSGEILLSHPEKGVQMAAPASGPGRAIMDQISSGVLSKVADIPNAEEVGETVPAEDLPAEDLPAEDLPAEDLPAEEPLPAEEGSDVDATARRSEELNSVLRQGDQGADRVSLKDPEVAGRPSLKDRVSAVAEKAWDAAFMDQPEKVSLKKGKDEDEDEDKDEDSGESEEDPKAFLAKLERS